MGNCLGSLFGTIRRKSKKNYFTGRYKEYNVGIEFESLIEDDLAQQSECATVTDQERDHLLNKRYSDLIQDQNKRDAEIDSELKRQEENIRLEEEAYIAAKRESARAAHQARALEQQRSKPVANGTAKSSWLGDNENEWNVAGGEDDFEMFLESVKARSQSVRANVAQLLFRRRDGHTNSNKLKPIDSSASMEWEYEEGMALKPYNSSQYNPPHLANLSPKGNAGGSVSTQEASSEQMESDSDFEPEYVGADMTQEKVTDGQVLSQNGFTPTLTMPVLHNSSVNNPSINHNKVVAQMHGGKSTTLEGTGAAKVENGPDLVSSHVTQSTAGHSGSDSIAMITAPEKTCDKTSPVASVTVNNSNTKQTNEVSTKPSEKPAAVVEDDPFDFDKFLEELDLE